MFNTMAEDTRKPKRNLFDQIKQELKKSNVEMSEESPKNVLCLGEDGTGKTGSILSLLCDDMKDDEVVVVLDNDGSALEIIKTFHYDAYKKNKIMYYKPYDTKVNSEGVSVINHKGAVEKVRTAAEAIKALKEDGVNIKAVVFDGVSFLLESCENIMRLDKGLDADSGAQTKFWKIRAKNFRECTEVYLQLPINVFFIGHSDFIHQPDDTNFPSVKQRLHDSCSHRIIYTKENDDKNDYVFNLVATIDKDRSNILNLKRKIKFASVNMKTNTYEWNADKINVLFEKPQENEDIEDED